MSGISIISVKTDVRHFSPKVDVSGLSVTIRSAPWRYEDKSGTMEEAVISFTQADAGKNFDVSLARRKNDGQLFYYLLVQAPEVVNALVPELNQGVDVLFPLVNGQVDAGGAALTVRVRQFVP